MKSLSSRFKGLELEVLEETYLKRKLIARDSFSDREDFVLEYGVHAFCSYHPQQVHYLLEKSRSIMITSKVKLEDQVSHD